MSKVSSRTIGTKQEEIVTTLYREIHIMSGRENVGLRIRLDLSSRRQGDIAKERKRVRKRIGVSRDCERSGIVVRHLSLVDRKETVSLEKEECEDASHI